MGMGMGTNSGQSTSSNVSTGNDLLGDLFGGGGGSSTNTVESNNQGIGDLMSGMGDNGGGLDNSDIMSGFGGEIVQQPQYPTIIAFQGDGITIKFSFEKEQGSNQTKITLSSTSTNDVSNFVVHAACPRFLTLQWLDKATSTSIAANSGAITQNMLITNSQQGAKKILLRLKIDYVSQGVSKSQKCQVDNIPSEL